jgi:hypothetical protein
MIMYESHRKERIIDFNLYGKGKIPCLLTTVYGSHNPKSEYKYAYKQIIKERRKH